jgi:hypothetical protein
MTGIHDVFPANTNDSNDPISEKKLQQNGGEYFTTKIILGLTLMGSTKQSGLRRQNKLIYSLFSMVGSAQADQAQPVSLSMSLSQWWARFISLHSYTSRTGATYTMQQNPSRKPSLVYLQQNPMLHATITGCQTLL